MTFEVKPSSTSVPSTGGFTEYALLRGAKKVIAIEKGTRQMKAPLRFDSRIDLREKTDIFFGNS